MLTFVPHRSSRSGRGPSSRPATAAALASALSLLLASSALGQAGGGGDCAEPPPIPPEGSLPEGFGSNVFAEGLDFLAVSAWDNQGRLFVGEAFFDVPDPAMMVWKLEDTDGDGQADVQEPFAGPFGQVLGLAFRPRLPSKEIGRITREHRDTVANLMRRGVFADVEVDLYVNHNFTNAEDPTTRTGHLTRVRDLDGDGNGMGPGETVDLITDLPSGADHNNDHLAVGPEGGLFFGQGIRTNWGDVNRPDGNLAVLDCIIHEDFLNGTILRASPDGSELEVVACGFRNPFGIGFLPNGALLVTDNGPDVRNCFPLECAPDELNVIFPVVPKKARDPDVDCTPRGPYPHYGAPDFAGVAPRKSGTISPIHEFPPSVSANGFDVNLTDTWCGFEGDAFVAEFGNFGNFPPFTQGRRIERIELLTRGNGVPFAAVRHDFGGQFAGHPTDAKFGPDDALYVTLFSELALPPGTGKVIRIFPLDEDGNGVNDICE